MRLNTLLRGLSGLALDEAGAGKAGEPIKELGISNR